MTPTRPVWTLALNNQLTAPPAYDAARAFFPIEHNRLVAYDLISAAQSWLVEARPLFQPATGDGLVFFVESDAIVALQAADGSQAWMMPIAEPIGMRPVWGDGWLLIAARSGTLFGFRAIDGALIWQRELGSPAHGPPAISADRVYVPTENSRIIALQLEDGAPVWEKRIGGAGNEILAANDRLFAGSTDNYMYCVMVKDGRTDWRWRTGGDVIGMPVADERNVYFVSADNVLRALNRTTGGQQWMRPMPLRPTAGPVKAGATLVVSGLSQTLRTYNVKDGAPVAEINANADIAAPPHPLEQPVTGLPMLLVVTRDLVKGAGVTLHARSIDPPVSDLAPLSNLITLPLTLAPPTQR